MYFLQFTFLIEYYRRTTVYIVLPLHLFFMSYTYHLISFTVLCVLTTIHIYL